MVDFSSSGHHPVPSSHEVATHGFGMKAHSLLLSLLCRRSNARFSAFYQIQILAQGNADEIFEVYLLHYAMDLGSFPEVVFNLYGSLHI